jgi:DNA primase
MAEGIECSRVLFPREMDANEYARKVTPADQSLGALLRNAVWLGKGKAHLTQAAVEVVPVSDERSPNDTASVSEPLPVPANASGLIAAPEPPPSLAASVAAKEKVPPRPKVDVPTEIQGDDITITLGDRRYRVRGLAKNLSFDQLKVNILVSRASAFHVDTLELYSSRQRGAYAKEAAAELKGSENTIANDLGQILLKLEELQEEQIRKTQEPNTKEVVISEDDERVALELLRDPRLLDRILAGFAACGVVGEETNKLVGYLAAVSRKLEEPLAVIIQSSSAAGKTSLMEAVLAFMPEEDRVKYSAMTGQSLFYMGETDLKHKILAIVEEAGAEKASYALLLQSEGELMIASTGKDPSTGRLVTQEYRVEGPVMIFLTTTAIEVDEELLNRCLVLTVDEEREQTRAIHRQQREKQTLEGLLARRARPAVLKVHQDAQRLLKPLLVANPYARHLTFLDDRTRTRRDHVKYLTLIRTITLLHQYQREVKTTEHRGAAVPYIEVVLEDVAMANRLTHQVLGRTLDELAPQTRRLLLALDGMVREACESLGIEPNDFRFTRKVVREKTGWGHTQVHVHLARLVELEYVQLHRGNDGAHVYELLYDGSGKDGTPFLTGLLDVQALREPMYDGKNSGVEVKYSGLIRAGFGPLSGPIWPGAIDVSPSNGALKPIARVNGAENARLGSASSKPSRRNGDTGSAETSPGTH